MKLKNMYLLLVVVVGLFTLAIYSTYAMFTSTVEIGNISMDTDLNYTFKINSNQEFTIGARSKLRFNAIVENDMTSAISYGIYYKMINPGTLPSNIRIAEVTESSNSTTSGPIQPGTDNNITVPLVIINNTDESITVQIGVRTGYYNDNNQPGDIIYEQGEVLITDMVDSETAGSYSCELVGEGDCTEECYTITENGYKNTYCTTTCTSTSTELTNSEEIINLDPSGANAPKLVDNMIPVMYNGSNWVKADSENSDENYKWYDYTNKQWANAVLVSSTNRNTYVEAEAGTVIPESEVLAYYVWIPRYKYKVFNVAKTIGTDSYNAKTTGIDIVFEEGTSSTGEIKCNNYSFAAASSSATNETCSGTNGQYYTHPAFTFGDTELTGIWVGKFESASSNPSASYGGSNSTTLTVRVKPNMNTWRNNPVSNFYTVIKNMQNNGNEYGLSSDTSKVDSHMLKNIEWGAVAYLTHSDYGRCSNGSCSEIGINNYYSGSGSSRQFKTGCGANAGSSSSGTCNEYTTSLGMNASSTGNIYGIYDLSGGAYEYVMGNMSSGSGSYTYNAKSAGSNFSYSASTAKYIDTYAYGTSYGDQTAYNRARLGDATGEVVSSSYTAWNNDYANFVLSSFPWFLRGGNAHNGSGAGVFYFNYKHGVSGTYFSARAALLPL